MQTRFPDRALPYILLSPSVIVVLIFFVIPSVQSLYLSFFRVNMLGTKQIFVGLDNFARLFQDAQYLNSAFVSLQFAIFVVAVGLGVSLSVAMVANQRYRGFVFYRTMLIWPYALSPAIAALIWGLMMDPSFGIVSHIIETLTGIRFSYLTNGLHALLFLAVAATWKMLGYNIIFFLAGLQSMQVELLEAASIDGANSWHRFWRIVFPLLSPTTFFLFIMNTLYAFFQVFGMVHITTEGGPGRATDLLVFKLYRDGFIGMNTGFASAQSIVLLVMVAALTLLQFRYAGRRVVYQ
jgi:sn-glycerol 3-phosphate transport system permease protein